MEIKTTVYGKIRVNTGGRTWAYQETPVEVHASIPEVAESDAPIALRISGTRYIPAEYRFYADRLYRMREPKATHNIILAKLRIDELEIAKTRSSAKLQKLFEEKASRFMVIGQQLWEVAPEPVFAISFPFGSCEILFDRSETANDHEWKVSRQVYAFGLKDSDAFVKAAKECSSNLHKGQANNLVQMVEIVIPEALQYHETEDVYCFTKTTEQKVFIKAASFSEALRFAKELPEERYITTTKFRAENRMDEISLQKFPVHDIRRNPQVVFDSTTPSENGDITVSNGTIRITVPNRYREQRANITNEELKPIRITGRQDDFYRNISDNVMEMLVSLAIQHAIGKGFEIQVVTWENEYEREEGLPSTDLYEHYMADYKDDLEEGEVLADLSVNAVSHSYELGGCVEIQAVRGKECFVLFHEDCDDRCYDTYISGDLFELLQQ